MLEHEHFICPKHHKEAIAATTILECCICTKGWPTDCIEDKENERFNKQRKKWNEERETLKRQRHPEAFKDSEGYADE